MDFEFRDFGFYLIDEPYLKYLHNIDEEVRYDEYKDYDRKPFVGILAQVGIYTYFMKILAALDIKKMVPVPEGLYKKKESWRGQKPYIHNRRLLKKCLDSIAILLNWRRPVMNTRLQRRNDIETRYSAISFLVCG